MTAQEAALSRPAVKAASAGRMPDRTNSHWVLRRPGSARNWRRCHGGQARPATGPSIPPAGGRGLDCAARPAGNAGPSGRRQGIVLFAHGSGSSRLSRATAWWLNGFNGAGLGTLLFDLLQPEEADDRTNVFDISLLAERLALATDWVCSQELRDVPIGYFGASTGAAAALVAETLTRHRIAAVVSRGGRRIWRVSRSPRPGANAPDRWRRRSWGDRAERGGADPSHLREAHGGCARGRAPVRGARHARSGGDLGA